MSYYTANNQMHQPLVASSLSYPVLSVNPPSANSVPSNAIMTSPSTMEPTPHTVNINIAHASAPPTFRQRVTERLSTARTYVTWTNVFKTLLVLGALTVGTLYTVNVVKSAIAPPVDVGSITPICSASSCSALNTPLDFLVNVTIGGRDGYGETSSQVALYAPVTIYSTVDNVTTNSTTFQYLGSGKLVTAVNKAQPIPAFNATALNDDMWDGARPDHQDMQMTGIVTLPASDFTNSIKLSLMKGSNSFTSTVVLVEVQTFIRQWFKDLNFIRNQQVTINQPNVIA